jgi:hypothetical protein
MRLIASLAVGVIMGFTSSGLCAGDKAESTSVTPCPPLTTGEATNGWLLAEGNYTARQIGNAVTVRVQGTNPTPNYENKLVKSPKMISPPELINLRKAPSGIQPQVISSYHACGSFRSQEKVKSLIIHDKSGKHTINVEQAVASRPTSSRSY